MIPKQTDRILIWDSETSPPTGNFTNVLWRRFATPELANCVSIPELIEKNAGVLRSRYLAWVYEFGELRIDGRRLIDHLKIRPGLSYWWMTLIAEKCNWAKSPQITDAIRLFAFEDWVKHYTKVKVVTLASNNRELRECLEIWCETKKIHFESRRLSIKAGPKVGLRQIFNRLPHTVQVGLWLVKYLIDRWPLRDVGVEEWRNARSQITFVSYFFNMRRDASQAELFESEYWTELPRTLDKENICSSWLHLYVKNPVAPTAKAAAKLIGGFNRNSRGMQSHVTLDSFLSIKIVICAVRDYLQIRLVMLKDFSKIQKNEINESQLMEWSLLPLFKKDWERSFFSREVMQSLLTFHLFKKAFTCLPKQAIGVYLQENQGWEFGMIQSWRANAHGKLIGFPHSTVRFWDLRYFFDSRSFLKNEPDLPMPDLVAVSGDLVKSAYLEGGYPADDLVDVEALRYLHLGIVDDKQPKLRSFSPNRPQVLVLGDYLPSDTALQMNLLREIADELSNMELTVKPHPACPIVVSEYPELDFKLVNQPLSELLPLFDVAYTSSVTSSAIEAYSAGLKVITVLNSATLNISSVRGVVGVRFISSAETLRAALREAVLQRDGGREIVQCFNVDASLPRWRTLLSDDFDVTRS